MTPCILAVDCGGEFASLALSRGGEVLEEAVLHSPEGFGGLVFDQLDGLLARHKTRIGDIDCFAAAAGPGSFTGLRIALSAVKGLAEACGKPALAVSNLEAMASFGAHSRRACFYDARRGDVYGGFYNAALEPLAEEVVCPFPRFIDMLAAHPGDWELLAPDFGPFAPALGARFAAMPRTQTPRTLAAAVARIASERFVAGRSVDPAALDANYVRRSDAELSWKEM